MLQPGQQPIKDGVYDVKQVRITNNTDGTVKVELILPMGSFVVTVATNAAIEKSKV